MQSEINPVPIIPFKEAIEALENKVILPTEHWADISPKIHARGFMVTGALKHNLLVDIHKEISNDLKNGGTLESFRERFDDICSKHGWQPKGGKDFRARVIYDTNINMAYSSGRWAQMQRVKDIRPYVEYVAILDGRTRPSHRSLHGQVHHIDSKFWNAYMPPNGWRCRCLTRSLNKAEMEAYNITPEPMIEDIKELPIETRLVKINGKKQYVDLPKGISYGFDNNVGKSTFGNILSKQDFDAKKLSLKGQKEWQNLNKGDWQSYGLSKNLPIQAAKAKIGPTVDKNLSAGAQKIQMIALTKQAFNMKDDIAVIDTAAGKVLIDAKMLGEHLPIERAPFLPLMKEVLIEPAEVWQAFEESKITGKVELRQRFIKVIKSEKSREFLFIAQSYKGQIVGWSFMRKNKREVNQLRAGNLLFKGE